MASRAVRKTPRISWPRNGAASSERVHRFLVHRGVMETEVPGILSPRRVALLRSGCCSGISGMSAGLFPDNFIEQDASRGGCVVQFQKESILFRFLRKFKETFACSGTGKNFVFASEF